jgi:hypothetical protein
VGAREVALDVEGAREGQKRQEQKNWGRDLDHWEFGRCGESKVTGAKRLTVFIVANLKSLQKNTTNMK